MTVTIGYAGAPGHHYARLVDQNFLYNRADTPVYAAYFATDRLGGELPRA